MSTFDAVVVGAGVFGAWTALYLRQSGRTVALLDAYGAGNSRSSSGGESRILRMGYGADEIYTRWAVRSRELWTDLFDRMGRPELFQMTGVLWTPRVDDPRADITQSVFERYGVPLHRIAAADLVRQFPQLCFREERVGLFEPQSGVLLARQAVNALVAEAVRQGVVYCNDAAVTCSESELKTESGKSLSTGATVYACGPWLPKIFPDVLGARIRITRQEVFFFGASPSLPVWIDITGDHGAYTIPNIESRGFKLAFDRHGPEFDPDTGDRIVLGLEAARVFLSERFPGLAGAPLVESRVCQYENTSTGDFLIDRHPGFENVWLVGGGSGHGFKHGPAVGEHVCSLMDGKAHVEPRFSLESKSSSPRRTVF